MPRGRSGRGVGVEVAGQHAAFPQLAVPVERQGETAEVAPRVAQQAGVPFGLGLQEDAARGVEGHVARVELGEYADVGVESIGLVARAFDVVDERILPLGVVAPLLPQVVEPADLPAGLFFLAVVDALHVVGHARTLVFGARVVDASADTRIEAANERRAVGDADDSHRRGEALRIALRAVVVTHAVEGAGKIDESARVAQPLFVVVEDVVAREAKQDEFLGRHVAVDRDVRGGRDRVGAVEPVEARQQESDAESHVRRVVGAGSDAPVDLFLERAVDVRLAVIVDDAAQQAVPFRGRRTERICGREGVRCEGGGGNRVGYRSCGVDLFDKPGGSGSRPACPGVLSAGRQRDREGDDQAVYEISEKEHPVS